MADVNTTKVQLTDEEFLLLDGKCRPEIQLEVNQGKIRLATKSRLGHLTTKQAAFVANTVARGIKDGKLVFQFTRLRMCDVCNRYGGYLKFKSGRRRGQDNHDKPICLQGVELADSFIRMSGYATHGCCSECWGVVKPAMISELADSLIELPDMLYSSGSKRYAKSETVACAACRWQGPKHLLGPVRTMMGDGYFYGRCPSCGGESGFLSSLITTSDNHSWTMVEVDPKASATGLHKVLVPDIGLDESQRAFLEGLKSGSEVVVQRGMNLYRAVVVDPAAGKYGWSLYHSAGRYGVFCAGMITNSPISVAVAVSRAPLSDKPNDWDPGLVPNYAIVCSWDVREHAEKMMRPLVVGRRPL